MSFLPKDYVWVNTRIDQFHAKYQKWSIETFFEINGNIVIFTAKVSLWEDNRVFTGHSFWTVWKEKAFEKLETVSVWRALAFAGFETREWIASKEEMEVFEENQWVKPLDFDEYLELIKKEDNVDSLRVLFKQAFDGGEFTESQMEVLKWSCEKRKERLENPEKHNSLPPLS